MGAVPHGRNRPSAMKAGISKDGLIVAVDPADSASVGVPLAEPEVTTCVNGLEAGWTTSATGTQTSDVTRVVVANAEVGSEIFSSRKYGDFETSRSLY